MAWQQGDVYRCTDASCECEVELTVSKAPKGGKGGDNPPLCCCGKRMTKVK